MIGGCLAGAGSALGHVTLPRRALAVWPVRRWETTQPTPAHESEQLHDGACAYSPAARRRPSPTLPYRNGRTEGGNTKIKMLKRLMCGRAGHRPLRVTSAC
ncbi:hypothetical protein ACE1SV_00970 [Streptomyces sennicomposti]